MFHSYKAIYHVQRVQALQSNDYIRRQEVWEWVIQMCVDQPDFLQIILFTNARNGVFNSQNTSHIQQHRSGTMQEVLQGFGTVYIEGHRHQGRHSQ
jgi:hypothetical protein